LDEKIDGGTNFVFSQNPGIICEENEIEIPKDKTFKPQVLKKYLTRPTLYHNNYHIKKNPPIKFYQTNTLKLS
jgi:hypothetical protein